MSEAQVLKLFETDDEEEPLALVQQPALVMTCIEGTNADLFPVALSLYVEQGASIADVTYGKGVFWRNVPRGRYTLVPSDLETGIDFRHLPYDSESFDALVLDPPYMHGGATVKKSINDCYHNQNGSHQSVVALYLGGLLEARRVLVKNGVVFVKCQDEIESGKQHLTHVELLTIMPMIGFRVEDMFVLHTKSVPAMRENYQLHARKNHSYLIIGRLTR